MRHAVTDFLCERFAFLLEMNRKQKNVRDDKSHCCCCCWLGRNAQVGAMKKLSTSFHANTDRHPARSRTAIRYKKGVFVVVGCLPHQPINFKLPTLPPTFSKPLFPARSRLARSVGNPFRISSAVNPTGRANYSQSKKEKEGETARDIYAPYICGALGLLSFTLSSFRSAGPLLPSSSFYLFIFLTTAIGFSSLALLDTGIFFNSRALMGKEWWHGCRFLDVTRMKLGAATESVGSNRNRE